MDKVTVAGGAAATIGDVPQTRVLLCQDLEGLVPGLALGELLLFLEGRFPDLLVEVVPGLCGQPGRHLQRAAGHGATRAVLALCSGDYSEAELQSRARKAGLDPFGVEVVPLGTLCAGVQTPPQATRKVKALMAAAVARARAYEGSTPDQAKPSFLSWDKGVSRRSLFTLPPIVYRAVPGFQRQLCGAGAGCDLCVKACPRDALSKQGAHIALNKTRCEGCGVCLVACPRGAVDLPGGSLPQFEAQLSALLDPEVTGPEAPAILFTCHRAADRLEAHEVSSSPDWLPVVVPCLGMVTPAWVLQTLAHGAREVALLMCGHKCPLGQQEAVHGRADFCRQLLERLGQVADRVRVLTASSPEALFQALERPLCQEQVSRRRNGGPPRLGACDGTLDAVRWLRAESGFSSGMELEHAYSPFGVLELRAETCTGCLACAQACPTGALALERGGKSVALTYAASQCNGCRICVDVCPEVAAHALTVHRVTRLEALSRGRVVLYQDQMAICHGCGEAFASQAVLRRIAAQIGGDNPALNAAVSCYCPSCRMTSALYAAPGI